MRKTFIASSLFEHETVEGLLRELRRNKQLRTLCGFEPKAVKQKDGSIKIGESVAEPVKCFLDMVFRKVPSLSGKGICPGKKCRQRQS